MSHSGSELLATDIDAYLEAHEHKSLLRFITCGSVDDGKSTLIGRLLYESKLVFEDHLTALEADSKKVGTQGGELDFALLVDGLAAEREQGITIDVAYRFFSTERRKFIVADTPGHEQYTRNMVTGASTASLAVVMIDARKGVLVQTRRHSYLVSLLGIRHVVLAVNKLDLMDYSQEVYDEIVADYRAFAAEIGIEHITAIPMSALRGDNIVERSPNTPWYTGPTIIEHLETVEIDDDVGTKPFRMPVQWVNRPDLDFRGFSGLIVGGTVRAGDRVRVLPSGRESTVARIVTFDGDLDRAVTNQSVTLTLADEIDISRGDVVVAADEPPPVADAVRGPHRVDGRAGDAPRPALPGEDRHDRRRRRHRPPQVRGQRQHARAHRGHDAAAQPDRGVQRPPRPARPVRSVRREPGHGRLHRHRPPDQRHHRRRSRPLRVAPGGQRALGGPRGRPARARVAQAPGARRPVVHRHLGRRQVDPRQRGRAQAARPGAPHVPPRR